jgi:hypothetical protein
MRAPVAAASSRCPERKSAWKWVSSTRSIVSPKCFSVLDVLRDVSLRVDHDGSAGGLVADQIAEQ